MKEQIKLLTEAFRLNKPVYYKGRYIMKVYIPTLNFKTGVVKIRYATLESDIINIMDLEVKDA